MPVFFTTVSALTRRLTLTLGLLGLAATAALAQNNIGVGTTTPHPSAVLDVSSSSQGLLAPRLTQAQRNAIGSPATGLLIYQTDNTPGFYVYTGAAWTAVAGSGGTGSPGPAGANGLNALVKTTAEAAGANCATGGTRVDSGQDTNGNGSLDAGEITSTRYVCNGTNGAAGTAGSNGADGKNSLVRTTAEAAGPNCATGGFRTEYGLDANGNGTLDAGEVNAALTRYVCNGAQGPAGSNGATGPAGPGVPTGGTAGQVLSKVDGTNYNTTWTTPSSGGGARLELLTRKLAATQALPVSGPNAVADVVVFENVATAPTVGGYNTSTNTYTAGATGLYLIQVEYTVVDQGNNTVGIYAYAEVNGGSSIVNNVYPPYISNGSIGSLLPTGLKGIGSYSYLVFLNQNDTVRIKAFGQNSATQQTMNNNGGCQLMVVKL